MRNACSASAEDNGSRRSDDGGNGRSWNDQPISGADFGVADASTAGEEQAAQAPAIFGGFSVTATHTMRHLVDLHQRNIILNCTEAAISALLLLSSLSSETSFGVTERLLHIVACTSSVGYLWCVPTCNAALLNDVHPYAIHGGNHVP